MEQSIFTLTQTLLIFSELKYAQIKGIVDTENEKKITLSTVEDVKNNFKKILMRYFIHFA